MSRDRQEIVRRLYDEVNTALWALLCVVTFYVFVFVVPHMPEIHAQAERLRQQELAAEDRLYCGKWGMPDGSERFLACAFDLQKIRAAAEQRLAETTEAF